MSIASALDHGREVLSQIVRHYKPAPSDSGPEQLWQ